MPLETISKPVAVPRPASAGEETFALHCRAYGLLPVREYVFHPKRRWRFDFAFPEHKLSIEIEGGVNGRHQRRAGFEADCVKYAHAAVMGWLVMRFTTNMVMNGQAIDFVLAFLNKTRLE